MEGIIAKEEVVVKLGNRTNIHSIEREIREQLRATGQKLMKKILVQVESRELSSIQSCSCGRKNWRHLGRVKRQIKSLAGEVEYRRVRMKCRNCGKEFYPLDEILNLRGHSNMTLGLIEQSLYLATDTAYDRASSNLERMTGLKVSGRQMQNLAKEEGLRIREKLRKERFRIFEEGSLAQEEEARGRVFVQVDGTFVKHKNKQETQSLECKVGIIYSRKAKVSKNRMKILDKRTYATTQGIETFREEFIAECARWGVWSSKEILFIGDGASWIKRICQGDFPRAVYLLDFWHLAENITRALGEEHRQAADNWLQEIKETYDAQLLLKRIRGLYARIRNPARREKIRDLYDYVNNNKEGINNWKKVNALGASGAIEKTVDVTVARRFKRRGMSWLYPGLSSLLTLRVLKLNGEWDNYWRLRGLPL